jgi:hypothetical protein
MVKNRFAPYNPKYENANSAALEGVNMRNALISGLFIIFFGSIDYTCCKSSFVNLREPIYLVADQNFWSGCRNHSDGNNACRRLRIEQISNGINEWLNYFDESDRPQLIIAYSSDELPSRMANTPIHLQIRKDYCGQTDKKIAYPACYKDHPGWPPAIIFDSPEEITPHIAHEFGHALGRNHNDMPEDVYSIMSYTLQAFHVLPLDIKIMCKTHTECPPLKNTR